jgi:hypothetical protein
MTIPKPDEWNPTGISLKSTGHFFRRVHSFPDSTDE